MLNRNYLRLQLNRLHSTDEWASHGPGIAFIFASRGNGQFRVGGVAHAFSKGDVLVFGGEEAAKLRAANGDDFVFWSFVAQLEHLFPLFADDEIWLLQDLRVRLKTMRFYGASSAVAAECHRLIATAPPQFNLGHRTHLLKLAATIFAAELSEVRPQKGGFIRIEDHLKAVFDGLSIDELLELSVDDLATRFSCSRRHLNRLFHQHLGLSISALRMEMRLLKAATLLRDSDAKIISVAEACGFNHLGLFNTCFKRRFGVSPGHWRTKSPPVQEVKPRKPPPSSGCQLASAGLCPLSASFQNGHANGPSGIGCPPTAKKQGTSKPPFVCGVAVASKPSGKPAKSPA